jgi:hypothetical protein
MYHNKKAASAAFLLPAESNKAELCIDERLSSVTPNVK